MLRLRAHGLGGLPHKIESPDARSPQGERIRHGRAVREDDLVPVTSCTPVQAHVDGDALALDVAR